MPAIEITGLDRFGRIVEDAYINALTGQYTDDFAYTYNRDSNVLTEDYSLNPTLNQSFGYNGLNELTGYARANGESQGFTTDALGNFTSVVTNGTTQTRTANAQNEYTSVSGGVMPTYDANGNLTTDPTTGNTFTYDAWNRLVKVTGSDSTALASYQYDAVGRRDVETKGGTATALYYNDKWQVIEERANGQTTAQNVWSPIGSDKMVAHDTNPVNGVLTQRTYVQQDMIGNVTAALNVSGVVLARFLYTPFGQQTVYDANWNSLSASPVDLPYGFQCYRTDFGLNLADARERVYVIGLERFAQNDPIGTAGGSNNLYQFVGNNPINATDATGLQAQAEAIRDRMNGDLSHWKKGLEKLKKDAEDEIKNDQAQLMQQNTPRLKAFLEDRIARNKRVAQDASNDINFVEARMHELKNAKTRAELQKLQKQWQAKCESPGNVFGSGKGLARQIADLREKRDALNKRKPGETEAQKAQAIADLSEVDRQIRRLRDLKGRLDTLREDLAALIQATNK